MSGFACCSVIQFADGTASICPLIKGTLKDCQRYFDSIHAIEYNGEREDAVGSRVIILPDATLARLM